jgi:hypothetical protein
LSDDVGRVEAKVRADIAALVTGHPMGEALSEMAFSLARRLDWCEPKEAAQLNRELRACLVELASMAVMDDDDFESELSTPTRDTEDS